MRYLILFWAVLWIASPAAQAADKDASTLTMAAVDALAKFCLPPVQDKRDVAAYVTAQGLIELPKEQAESFSPNGGRVFEIPSTRGNAVLILNPQFKENCAIAIHTLRPALFWKALDKKMTGFALMREKRMDEEKVTKREYQRQTLAGPITLLVTASDVARPNGLQGLMTIARVQK